MNATSEIHDDDDNDHHDVKFSENHEDSRDSRDHDPIETSNDNKENDDEEDEEEDEHELVENIDEDLMSPTDVKKRGNGRAESVLMRFADSIRVEETEVNDPETLAQLELIKTSTPQTALEIALSNAIKRKSIHLNRVMAEIAKLKIFISKRKQTYKRKRKDDEAPTRALSAYNIFIQDRFALLAKENAIALNSENEDVALNRVAPAHLVAATGNVWKTLSPEEKEKYEERYVMEKYLSRSNIQNQSCYQSFLHYLFKTIVRKTIEYDMKRKWQSINHPTNRRIENETKLGITCSFHRMYCD